jgi:hypothetical protein
VSTDRSNDVSWELVSVRTVLTRTRTSIDEILANRERAAKYPDIKVDPEADEMLAALVDVVQKLERWQKAGRRRKNRYN